MINRTDAIIVDDYRSKTQPDKSAFNSMIVTCPFDEYLMNRKKKRCGSGMIFSETYCVGSLGFFDSSQFHTNNANPDEFVPVVILGEDRTYWKNDANTDYEEYDSCKKDSKACISCRFCQFDPEAMDKRYRGFYVNKGKRYNNKRQKR